MPSWWELCHSCWTRDWVTMFSSSVWIQSWKSSWWKSLRSCWRTKLLYVISVPIAPFPTIFSLYFLSLPSPPHSALSLFLLPCLPLSPLSPPFPSYLSCILILYLILSLSFTPSSQLVAGSIVMAFEVVCPDRIDLIHKNYRKLCSLLVDVDEWGQATILNMLTRYARTQFVDPNKEVCILNHTPKILPLS